MNAAHPFPIGLEIHELARTLRRAVDAWAGARGLTQEQWRTLWHLSRNEGISQAGLADILEMQPISLGRLIDRMEAAGLVARRPHPSDRRVVRLYLAAGAAPCLADLRDFGAELNETVSRGLSAGERETLLSLLRRLRQNVERAGEAAPATTRRVKQAS